MVFTSGRKELQFPEYEIRVLSSRWKSFLISCFFCKNSSEYETLSLRLVWSRVCAFLYNHGPRLFGGVTNIDPQIKDAEEEEDVDIVRSKRC